MITNKKSITVYFNNKIVGFLSLSIDNKIYFQYDDEWIKNGFSISPFSLPLEKKLFEVSKPYFDGLFGVFADSLPDAWGKLLLKRFLKNKNISDVNILDKLAIIGSNGMGALEYKEEIKFDDKTDIINIDELSIECGNILNNNSSDSIDLLFKLGGSSGGARPKVIINIDNEEYIVKFSSHIDSKDAGLIEYDYYLCALECGIKMSESRLLESKICSGYFATKRFDRINNKKIHMISVAALLEVDHNIPSLDYLDLMKLTKILTNNNEEDIMQMYKRMCFNVFAKNKDDHSKNFSFLYNENENKYRLSPFYDNTLSNTYYNEHTTSINHKGKDILDNDLLIVGIKSGLNKKFCLQTINEIKNKVKKMLNKYL